MNKSEAETKDELQYFSRMCLRYFHNSFASFDTNKFHIKAFLELLNNRFPPIKLIVDVDNNEQLIDTLVSSHQQKFIFVISRLLFFLKASQHQSFNSVPYQYHMPSHVLPK